MTLLATWISPFTAFDAAFSQRALVAVLVIAVSAGALGGSIVLRDLPFFTHAIGTGAYPALVVAVATGASLAGAAIVGALAFAIVLALITVATRKGAVVNAERRDAFTGIAIAGALAVGAVLASTIGRGNARLSVSPEALLFGSILTVSTTTLIVASAVSAFVAVCWWLFGERWLASGFDPGVASQLRARKTDTLLLICIALAAGATLTITGSLLAGALLVAPAATARVVFTRASAIAPATFILALSEGVLGLYLSIVFDFPSGASIAAVAGITFLLVAAAFALFESRRSTVLAPAALLALGALFLAGCGSSGTKSSTDTGPVKAVATSTQVGELVKEVGGDAVDVTTLLPPGADPHDYEPKPSAVAALAKTDVIFRSGGDIDGWLAPAVKAAGGDFKPVDLSTAVTLLPADEEDGATATPGEFNAHWYLSPDNVSSATRRVRDELIKRTRLRARHSGPTPTTTSAKSTRPSHR